MTTRPQTDDVICLTSLSIHHHAGVDMSDRPTLAFSRWHRPSTSVTFSPQRLLLWHGMNSASSPVDLRTPEGQAGREKTYWLVMMISDLVITFQLPISSLLKDGGVHESHSKKKKNHKYKFKERRVISQIVTSDETEKLDLGSNVYNFSSETVISRTSCSDSRNRTSPDKMFSLSIYAGGDKYKILKAINSETQIRKQQLKESLLIRKSGRSLIKNEKGHNREAVSFRWKDRERFTPLWEPAWANSFTISEKWERLSGFYYLQ